MWDMTPDKESPFKHGGSILISDAIPGEELLHINSNIYLKYIHIERPQE